MQPQYTFKVAQDAQMILAAMREHLPDNPSWTAVRKLLRARRVAIGGVLCVDEGRQLSKGEVITILPQPLPPPPGDKHVKVHFVDRDLVVAEKPTPMVTLRRKQDLNWPWARKNLQPTLDECVSRLIGKHAARKTKSVNNNQKNPRLLPVHRIDRDTSGLIAFARNKEAQTKIIEQFARHDAVRKYFALIPGSIQNQTVTSHLTRDRGDGLRGSTTDTTQGERAVTHFRTLQKIGDYSELECRLETGRTNQIRIHLAELGHPICGDIKYRGPLGKPPVIDKSKIRRMALHAANLCFEHPTTGEPMKFQTRWPSDMQRFLDYLQSRPKDGLL